MAPTVRRALHAKGWTHASQFLWPLHLLAGVNRQGAYLALLPVHFTYAFGSGLQASAGLPRLTEAVRLARLAEAPLGAKGEARHLKKTAASSSWILAPLAAEVALQQGELFLPSALRWRADIKAQPDIAFELLQPAFARQVVAMAQDIVTFSHATASLRLIDMGSGPGVHLLMLQELLPDLSVLAVEPDATAFAHLAENTQGVEGIKGHHGGFMDLDLAPGLAPVITCVGAAHHFNAAFMLQKCMLLLQAGGVLSVADEFLPEFHSQEERQLAQVRHHCAYIVSIMASLERSAGVGMDEGDGPFYEVFQQGLALASIDAEHGHSAQAVKGCRDLLARLRQQSSKQPTQPIGCYTRFFWRELQAMVAGFDHEARRQTYARRFAELAGMAGFELLRHRRVFATADADEWSGGTHVFTFRKPHH